MWVEDGVVEVPFFDRNSYIPDWNRPYDNNTTLYSLHNGIFHTTTNKDQFIDRNQLHHRAPWSVAQKVWQTSGIIATGVTVARGSRDL